MINEDFNEKTAILNRLDKLQDEIRKIQESLIIKSSSPSSKEPITNERVKINSNTKNLDDSGLKKKE